MPAYDGQDPDGSTSVGRRTNVGRIRVGEREVTTGIGGRARGMLKMLTPLGRPGTAAEAAGAVYLFCIPESDYVTGEVLTAGGGLKV